MKRGMPYAEAGEAATALASMGLSCAFGGGDCHDDRGGRAFCGIGQGPAGRDQDDLLGSAVFGFRLLLPTAASGEGRTAGFDRDRAEPRVSGRYLEYRGRRAVYRRRLDRCGCRACLLSAGRMVRVSVDGHGRGLGGLGVGDDPCRAEGEVRHQRNPCVFDAGLCGGTIAGLDVTGPAEKPPRLRLSGIAQPATISKCA